MFEIKVQNMTGSDENGLNIRTNASPKMGQDQVSVVCWLAAPVAMSNLYYTCISVNAFVDVLPEDTEGNLRVVR